jgi:hypothetical protein
MNSIKALEDLVQRVEAVAARLQGIDAQRQAVRLPDPPTPLTLDGVEEWAGVAEECCRKPRIAESRRLLKDKGIKAAAIPAHVLGNPDAIRDIMQEIEKLPTAFQKPALGAVGGALTKDFEDAEAIISLYREASEELQRIDELRTAQGWAYQLATREVAVDPGGAEDIVGRAAEVGQLCDLAVGRGIALREFRSLVEALDVLGELGSAVHDYERELLAEGLDVEENPIASKNVDEAIQSIRHADAALKREKARLQEQAASLAGQLEMIGGHVGTSGSTIAELREFVQALEEALAGRRRELRSSLGESVYHTVETMTGGTLPPNNVVSDGKLGAAIRKAVKCGYMFRLEAPREN